MASESATAPPAAISPTGTTSVSTWHRTCSQVHNLITATVWNFGVYAPIAQISDRTAFLLESEAAGPAGISTPKGWMVEEEPGHRPSIAQPSPCKTYFASGPGEEIDASKYDWNWKSATTGPNWVPAASPMRDSIFGGVNHAHSADTTGDNPWGLIPDELPHMEYRATQPGKLCVDEVSAHPLSILMEKRRQSQSKIIRRYAKFPAEPCKSQSIHIHLLLDRKTLTTAYPELTVSGGKGAHIVLTYSEALYDKAGHKGDRDRSEPSRARPSASPTASSPTAAPTASSCPYGGEPGAISTSTSPPATNPSPSSH